MGGVRGEKVLQLNYIVCGEETGADRQMAVDKCCWGIGRGWGGGVSRCSHGTKGGGGQRNSVNKCSNLMHMFYFLTLL